MTTSAAAASPLSADSTVVIVGAGQAGSEFAAELRKLGFEGRVVMVGDEASLPYKRPPLSKGYLTGTVTAEQLPIRGAAVHEKNRIEFIGSTTVTALDRAAKQAKSGDKELKARCAALEEIKVGLDQVIPVRAQGLSPAALEAVKGLALLTAKPVLFVANVDENNLGGNEYSARVAEFAAKQGAECVVICAALEAELSVLGAEDRAQFLAEMGLEEPGLNRFIRAGYKLLGLQTYFTAGPKEARAWTIPKGATAPQAAGVIHTDFERGFIRAEVIAYDDYIACKGESGAQAAGKLRLEGKEYVVQDGDVMHFRFNV